MTANDNAMVPIVRIYGVPVSKMNMQDTVAYLTEAIESRRPHHVITANPIMIMAALQDPDYMRMMHTADLIVPDGNGLVWATKYVGQPVSERVPGIDLIHELMRTGEARRWKVYMLGTTRETIAAAAAKLAQQYPLIDIVGFRDGFFGEEEDDAVVGQIRALEPDILLVGRSASTQEPWISKHKQGLAVPVIMGVGGSFDVFAGKLKRAPKLFQKLKLEWFYRLLQEPSRLGRMMVLPQFVMKVVRDKENVLKTVEKR
ncbi:WecB/TagA/CpsF family glycosyltransferase [Paenibacillus sp. FJAT-26967]|uniref:WecB/TagA/CpsF family glycosyltransferase n=1 Tax=Paenibacillus sp. FJAT-26967 TaxID=1729690 RepID=UPI0008394150|nr:WecB/TagA/CpsF family glycosyltransferase [Paenibacillus sp. FJAT-26967]